MLRPTGSFTRTTPENWPIGPQRARSRWLAPASIRCRRWQYAQQARPSCSGVLRSTRRGPALSVSQDTRDIPKDGCPVRPASGTGWDSMGHVPLVPLSRWSCLDLPDVTVPNSDFAICLEPVPGPAMRVSFGFIGVLALHGVVILPPNGLFDRWHASRDMIATIWRDGASIAPAPWSEPAGPRLRSPVSSC
jgi:hypothetical protein